MIDWKPPRPTVSDLLASDWPFEFAVSGHVTEPEPFDGHCPCAYIHGNGFFVDVHCWRSACDECRYSGVHVTGELDDDTKLRIAAHIRDNNGWSDATEWNVSLEERQ